MTWGRQTAATLATRAAEIQLRTFPSADGAFRSFVRAALLRNVTVAPDELQVAIRARYPVAVVRAQDVLARRGDVVVWYAFRYGSIVDPPAAQAHDWDEPGVAEALIDDERRFLEVNEALVAIVELPREAILGRAVEDFTNPDDPSIREDLAVLWAEFVASRTAESTIRFNRLDGTHRELAYRLVADDPVPGRHRLRVREVDAGQQ